MSNSGLSGGAGISGVAIAGGAVIAPPPPPRPPGLENESWDYLVASQNSHSGDRIVQAIDYLVKALKANGTYNLYRAIYPFVGGTADKHKWNLVNPQDTDAAYRLTYAGGVTHSSEGFAGASNGWADTKYTGSTNGIGFYTKSSSVTDDYGIGHLNGGNAGLRQSIHPKWPNDLVIMDPAPNARIQFSIGATTPIGHVAYSYSPGVDIFGVRNGVVAIDRTPVPTQALMTATDIPGSIYIGAVNGIAQRSTRTFSLATIANHLTRTQAIADSKAFAEFQARLGRHANPWTNGANNWTTDTLEDWY